MTRSIRLAALFALSFVAAGSAAGAQIPVASVFDRPAAARATRRVQVFSESFSGTASRQVFIQLDSGATYRMLSSVDTASVTLTPRLSSLPPVRFSTMTQQGSSGVQFASPANMQYTVETGYTGTNEMLLRIYREELVDCVADPTAADCQQRQAGAGGRKFSPALMVLAGLLPILFYGMMRNGKSF